MAEAGISSEEVDVYNCQPCSTDGRNLKAEGYCVNCQDYLCTTCFEHHRRPTPTRNHVLLDQYSMPRNNPHNIKLDILNETCSEHKDEYIKYFCMWHEALGCNACMMVRHRDCKTSSTRQNAICYIPDISGDITQSREYTDVCETLKSVEKRVHSCRNKAKANVEDIKLAYTTKVMQINRFRTDVNKMLDELENDIKNEALTIKNTDIAKMKSIINPTDNVESDIQITHLRLETLKQLNLTKKMFVAMQRAKTYVKEIEENISKFEKNNTIRHYEYEPPKQLRYLLNSMTSLGKLTVKEPEITKATHVADIDIKPKFFSLSYNFSGLAVLSNDQLAVVDSYNKMVKLADTEQMKILSELDLKSKPYDVTETVPGQIAITLPYINTIKIVSVGKKDLADCYDITVGEKCNAIVCELGDLIVSLDNPYRIQMISLPRGNVLKNINVHHHPGNLRDLKIAIDHDCTALYMVMNTISSVTFDGNVTSSVRGIDKDDLGVRYGNSLRDIAVDKYGAIYVCGYYTHTIYRKRPSDGAYRRFLKRDNGIECPISLAYCANKNKLYVGMTDNKCVKAYQLE